LFATGKTARSRIEPDLKRLRVAPLGRGGTDVGSAHHAFLQLVSLERTESIEQLRSESERLVAEGNLSRREADALDFKALAGFWCSEVGARIRGQSNYVRRELVFTARFSQAELAAITKDSAASELNDEFVVVQGS